MFWPTLSVSWRSPVQRPQRRRAAARARQLERASSFLLLGRRLRSLAGHAPGDLHVWLVGGDGEAPVHQLGRDFGHDAIGRGTELVRNVSVQAAGRARQCDGRVAARVRPDLAAEVNGPDRFGVTRRFIAASRVPHRSDVPPSASQRWGRIVVRKSGNVPWNVGSPAASTNGMPSGEKPMTTPGMTTRPAVTAVPGPPASPSVPTSVIVAAPPSVAPAP